MRLSDKQWEALTGYGFLPSRDENGDYDTDWWFDPAEIQRGEEVRWYSATEALAEANKAIQERGEGIVEVHRHWVKKNM